MRKFIAFLAIMVMALLAVPVFASPEPVGPPGKAVSIGMVTEAGIDLHALKQGVSEQGPLFSGAFSDMVLFSVTIPEITLAEAMYSAIGIMLVLIFFLGCYAWENYVGFDPRNRMTRFARDQC